jgi:hypothetical protein
MRIDDQLLKTGDGKTVQTWTSPRFSRHRMRWLAVHVLVLALLTRSEVAAAQDGGPLDGGADAAPADGSLDQEDANDGSSDGGGGGVVSDASATLPLTPAEQLAKFENAELMKYGVTGGVALSIQTQLSHRSLGGVDVHPQVAPAAIGYIQLNPFYWHGSQANREACSTQWSHGDEVSATIAAQAVAAKNAVPILDDIILAWRRAPPAATPEKARLVAESIARSLHLAWPTVKCRHTWSEDRCKIAKDDDILRHQAFVAIILLARQLLDPAIADPAAFRTELTKQLGSQFWNSNLKANCVLKRLIGLWAGWAFEYSAPNRQSADTKADGFAFGYALSPFAQVSVLLGVTRAVLHRPDYTDLPSWAFTAALGGNLDIVTSISKLLLKN